MTARATRRGILALAPAAALAPASAGRSHATNTPNPDARLIAICETFIRERDESDALWAPYLEVVVVRLPDAEQARSDELSDRYHRLRALIAAIPARTAAGLHAKASAMARDLFWECQMPECVSPNDEAMPAYSLARDVVAILARGVAL